MQRKGGATPPFLLSALTCSCGPSLRKMMLYVRYFVSVGAALLGLLFVVESYLPRPEAVRDRKEIDKSTIRISSAVSSPEKVVIDTTLPTIISQVQETVDVKPTAPKPIAAKPIAKSSREALAQIIPAQRPMVTAVPRKTLTHRIVVTRRAVVKRAREASLSEKPSNFFDGWFR